MLCEACASRRRSSSDYSELENGQCLEPIGAPPCCPAAARRLVLRQAATAHLRTLHTRPPLNRITCILNIQRMACMHRMKSTQREAIYRCTDVDGPACNMCPAHKLHVLHVNNRLGGLAGCKQVQSMQSTVADVVKTSRLRACVAPKVSLVFSERRRRRRSSSSRPACPAVSTPLAALPHALRSLASAHRLLPALLALTSVPVSPPHSSRLATPAAPSPDPLSRMGMPWLRSRARLMQATSPNELESN